MANSRDGRDSGSPRRGQHGEVRLCGGSKIPVSMDWWRKERRAAAGMSLWSLPRTHRHAHVSNRCQWSILTFKV